MSDPYLGQIMTAGFGFAPTGYALCNGAIMQVQQNQALFSLLGQVYGGNGSTTFALPDLQGRGVVGVGVNQATGTQYTLGQKAGAENVMLTGATVPAHQHVIQGSSNAGSVSPVGNVMSSVGPIASGGKTYPLYAPPGAMVPLANPVSSIGGGQPHPNVQPFLVLNFSIAMAGTYPPRP